MATPTQTRRMPEIYMQVIDSKKMKKLLLIQGASQRELADAVGWKSHSYAGLVLRGEIKTVTPDKAVRIAHFFGVGVDDLFVSRQSSDSGLASKRRSTTPQRKAS